MIRTIAGGEAHPLPTSPSRSSTYRSRRKPTTPFNLRASGRSSDVESDSFPWNTGFTPARDLPGLPPNDKDSQSLKFHPGFEASQTTPISQHQRRPSQPDSDSTVTSFANASKTDVSHAEQPPELQDEMTAKEQQAVLLVEDNNINMQVCHPCASVAIPPASPHATGIAKANKDPCNHAATQSSDEKTQATLRHGMERTRGFRPVVRQP